jgi:hypothetical protein
MKWMMHVVSVVSLLLAGLPAQAGDPATPGEKTNGRIGIYDSRAIAVAFAGSDAFNRWMSGLKAEYEKAKAAGDQKRIAELETEGAARQKLMHKQGFSTAPVENILEQIKEKLPAIKEKTGIDALVSKWDKDTLAKHPSAELVDITMELADTFNPNDRRRKNVIEIQKHDPIPLDQMEDIKD